VRKKNKKKKRGKGHEMHKSSGDSDGQQNAGEDRKQEEAGAEPRNLALDIKDPSKNGDIQVCSKFIIVIEHFYSAT